MKIKIANTIIGVSFLGFLSAFLPSQVLGSNGGDICGALDTTMTKERCEQNDRCEWFVLRQAQCVGGVTCDYKKVRFNEELCHKYSDVGCQWVTEKAKCLPKLPASKQKSPKT